MKILLIDDDKTFLTALKEFLTLEFKAEIEIVFNFRNVQSTTEIFQPDVILLDLGLGSSPEDSGLPVLRNLKRGYYTKHIPILVLSGHSETSIFKSAVRWGIDDYVIKPFEMKDLSMRIQKIILKKEQSKEE